MSIIQDAFEISNQFALPINPKPVVEYQYVVKVVCGYYNRDDRHPVVNRGCYTTAVNVHNRETCTTARIRRRLSIGLPGTKSGPVSNVLQSELEPCNAMEVDCGDIFAMAQEDTSFIKGFLVLESNVELDVVAVYTAAGYRDKEVRSIHTERVAGRPFNPCAHLFVDLDTREGGNWRVTKDPRYNGTINLPVRNTKANSAWGDIPGSSWINASGANHDGVVGDFTFECRFKLCCNFEAVQIYMFILADNEARVLLNGTQIGHHDTFKNPPKKIVTSKRHLFEAGENRLTIELTNNEGPTGLIVGGRIIAVRGNCDRPLLDLDRTPVFVGGGDTDPN